MHIIKFILISFLVFVSGCTYHGNLKTDIYKSNIVPTFLQGKAYMVWDSSHNDGICTSTNIFRNHDAELITSPGVKLAFIGAMKDVFSDVRVNSFIDYESINDYDVLLIPKFEVRGEAVYIQITARDAKSDELLDKYEASGNIANNTPTSATLLTIINIVPCALLCSPIIEPMINNIVGSNKQEQFESRINTTLKSIVIDMQNSRSLKVKNPAQRTGH